jgi:hypothetical protein
MPMPLLPARTEHASCPPHAGSKFLRSPLTQVEEEVQAMQKYLNDCIMGGDSSALEECVLWQRSIDETSGKIRLTGLLQCAP